MSPFEGELIEIYVAGARGDAPASREQAELRAGVGLVGDRYGDPPGEGAPKRGGVRAVTLIEAEAVEAVTRDYGIPLSAAETRRNLLVRGVPLNHLVGREFRVGEARLRGTELCEPCGYLERKTEKKALRAALVHRGGLRAEVLDGGVLRVGDRVRPEG